MMSSITDPVLMPYQNRRTFCGVPDQGDQKLVVVGAPYDGGTSYRPGARLAPHAIRDQSLMLTDGNHATWCVDLKQHVTDLGDWAIPTVSVSQAHTYIYQAHARLTQQGCHVVTLGGDHSITSGIMHSLHDAHGKIAVLHLDAHCDTWSDHFGQPHGHGTWLRDVIEAGWVNPDQVMSVGVRSPADSHTRTYLMSKGGTTVSAREAHLMGVSNLIRQIHTKLKSASHVYLSLDIDCLDPAHAPGTGTPEIGGLSSMFVSELLDELGHINWCGMDCVEVLPAHDPAQITSLAAATFVWQYLSMQSHKIAHTEKNT